MNSKRQTWSSVTKSRLPFAVNAMLDLSIVAFTLRTLAMSERGTAKCMLQTCTQHPTRSLRSFCLLGITHFVLTFKCAYNVAQQTPNKTQPAIANLTQKQRGVMLGTLLKELLPEQLGLSLRPVDSLTRLIC